MGLLRFFPTKDAWITNAFVGEETNLRATGSNLGTHPTLQVFKATGSHPTESVELARTLLDFDINYLKDQIITQGRVPSASVQYVLRAFDYSIGGPVAAGFDLLVYPVVGAWDEGQGQDDTAYVDYGAVSWEKRRTTDAWTTPGGDYGALSASQHFDNGHEDLNIDVTGIVNAWISGTVDANGFLLKLGNTEEENDVDYYRKVFYSHETQTVEKIPYLEARWNDVRKDNRGNFAINQPNALYFYNFVRGQLVDLPSSSLQVRLQDNWLAPSASFSGVFSASRADEGVYVAPISIAPSNPFSSSWIDVWTDSSGSLLMTGSFRPLALTGAGSDTYHEFVVSPEMKRQYYSDEIAHIRVPVRAKYYRDHVAIHTASIGRQLEYMERMFYSVLNNESSEVIIPFLTGTIPATQLSYDASGNYFNLWMTSFVPGFTYRFLFLIYYNKFERTIIDNKFIFKVI